MPHYLNDPREMAIRPESGVTLEEDNRVETMYHWGAMVLDLCNLPVSEYMKPGFPCGDGEGGGNDGVVKVTFVDQNGNKYVVKAEKGDIVGDLIPDIEGCTVTVPEDKKEIEVGLNDINVPCTVTPNNYKVSITVDGEPSDVTELPYGTDVDEFIEENYPPEEGFHTVIEKNHDTVPANDSLVVNVTHERNVWTLSYSTSGAGEFNLKGSASVEYDAAVMDFLPDTNIEGYVFTEWVTASGTVIDHDSRMPDDNLSVSGGFIEETAVVYYGSFFVPVSAYSSANISTYFNEEDLANPDIYKSATTKECADGKWIGVSVPVFPPFSGKPLVSVLDERERWYAPESFLVPRKVVSEYNIRISDVVGIDWWPRMQTDGKDILINGEQYGMYVVQTEHTRPGTVVQTYEYTMTITKK